MSGILRSFIFIVFFLCSYCSYGQIKTYVPQSEIDSLIGIIPNFQGAELVDHLNLIATSISQRYPDSCLHYANLAFELSDSINYEFGKTEAIFNFGNGYFYKIDLKNALTNYLAVLHIYDRFEASNNHGNLLLQLGFINTFTGNHEKAVDFNRRAQYIFSQCGNRNAELFAKERIGASMLYHIQNYDSALIYYNELANEFRELGNKKEEGYMLISLGNVFTSQKDGHNAKPYFEKSLMISEISNTYLVGIAYQNLGYVYQNCLDKPNVLKAEAYYLDAIQEYKRTGRYGHLPGGYYDCGNLYFQMRNYNAANKFLEAGLNAFSDFDALMDSLVYEVPDQKYKYYTQVRLVLSYIYHVLYIMNEEIGNHIKALHYYKLKIQAEDNIYTEANRRQTDVILANAENELVTQKVQLLEKEKELQEERAQRSFQFLIGLGALVIVVIFMAMLYVRQNKLKTEQGKTKLQQRLLRTQMNPHFLFNSLSSIQNYIIKEKPTKASDYLGRFSKLVRQILNNSVEEWISLEDEIGSIKNYIELQKVRYRDMFEYTLEVDEKIDQETTLVPPMLAQPFVENSIEHGFKHKENKGNMKIRFSLNGNLICFELEDDGVGRDKAMQELKSENKDHLSLSTDITRERLQVLNKKLKQKISLAIVDLKDDNGNSAGTKVSFDIPFKN